MPKNYPYASYLKTDRMTTVEEDGSLSVVRQPDVEVSREWVQNYVDAVDFFESINGIETVRHRQGVIYVKSVSPGNTHTREVVFTPITTAPVTATGDAHDTPHYQSRGNIL